MPRRQLSRVVLTLLIGAGLVLGTVSAYTLLVHIATPAVYDKDFGQDYLLARAIRDRVDPTLPIDQLAARYAEPVGSLAKPHRPTMGLLLLAQLLGLLLLGGSTVSQPKANAPVDEAQVRSRSGT